MLGYSIDQMVSLVVVLIVAFTVHEYAHAWTADFFGDDTPRLQGRLTLNPLKHLDPIGTLMLFFAGFGWAKPVMVNPVALEQRSPAAPMLVALAGPVSNFIMAVVAALPIRLGLVQMSFGSGGWLPTAFTLLYIFISLNLLLGIFNLIPVSPLDGEKVLYYFLPPVGRRGFDLMRQWTPIPMLIVLFVLPRIGLPLVQWVVGVPVAFLTRLLIG
ncbi:MAG: site-2 protease family protein [Anaerolineae bacterium]|nr:MAG: site-2 protease family protein [Anaerolineae bacterium]